MTQRTSPISNSVDAVKKRFKKAMDDAVTVGNWPPTGLGLGMPIFDAIAEVADQYPNAKPESIQKAQKAFDAYLARIAASQ